jgi:hypothetical protein
MSRVERALAADLRPPSTELKLAVIGTGKAVGRESCEISQSWADGFRCATVRVGVPVVSLAGPSAVSRGGLSILSNVGLPELVAATETDYVRIAVELARNLPRLAALRATLRERLQTSPLMDGPRFARHVEAAYRQMWRRWCASRS